VHIVAGILLIVNAAFAFAVWPTFYRRVATDPRARDAAGAPTRFLTVHRVIIGIAYGLGALSLVGGIASLIVPWY
jgi:hypothetical protein